MCHWYRYRWSSGVDIVVTFRVDVREIGWIGEMLVVVTTEGRPVFQGERAVVVAADGGGLDRSWLGAGGGGWRSRRRGHDQAQPGDEMPR
jgi:hypothetical protein